MRKEKQISEALEELYRAISDIKKKFDVEVNYISNSAKTKIEKLGGKVSLIK